MTEPLLKRFEKPLFWSAALFNYAFGLWVFNIDGFVAFFAGPEMLLNDPLSRFFAHIALLAILLFGIGYNLVALWPDRNRGIVFVGALGKVIIVPMIWVCHLDGGVGLTLAVAAIGDLLYAALFGAWLWTTRNLSLPPQPARTR